MACYVMNPGSRYQRGMAKTRLAKLEGMEKYLEKENCYLGEHPGRGIAGTEHTGSHEKKTS
ncbi:MAG: hypothetical protein L6Q53_12065 [Candidatus Brocadia sinica]|uniref:Uncharacterized protein n=1 Tax=Candidatus Brocadia sinica JPN1 TaxID=1197129 RepID=A0ABQ0K0C3_9BACT|nr:MULTISPECIES: hypothetical protein [Brocadia]MCK6468912.1 hypothetical protein [Candidatus Brocadia sinica]NOG42044.1 hypothetical protein [Planctomycetota bacterium]NUO04263.1 hypothetical protein [Candidatus Brocadia sinica]GAN34199.1 hypothetical protein BROSI_A2735 [Candidatus Brocadia sinica JPN1]GIK14461.1 MAG: hypothetical protein BroJett002_31680 [Candidatus Brocadia sinica]